MHNAHVQRLHPRALKRTLTHLLLPVALVAVGMSSAPVHATNSPTVEASGTFSFTTSPGIMPTWSRAGIALNGISPGSVITTTAALSARVTLPVVAKTGTANATAGGFRISNIKSGESVRCQVPTVDTRARKIDCVFADGTTRTLFVITGIVDRFKVTESDSITTFFRGIDMAFTDSESAASLNTALDTNVFSASVTVARGFLEASRSQPS
jgi:hypothetical protein